MSIGDAPAAVRRTTSGAPAPAIGADCMRRRATGATAPDGHAGIASGINNAVARAGSLFAVAALPVAVGLTGEDYADPTAFGHAFGNALLICAGLLVVGGVVSWFAIPAGPMAAVAVAEPVAHAAHQLDCPHRCR